MALRNRIARPDTGKDGIAPNSQKLKYHRKAEEKHGRENRMDFEALIFRPAWKKAKTESRGALPVLKALRRSEGPMCRKSDGPGAVNAARATSSVVEEACKAAACARVMMASASWDTPRGESSVPSSSEA